MPLNQHPAAANSLGPPSWMTPVTPVVPDHELIRRIGGGSYGDVWLARNAVGTWRAVKIVFRDRFTDSRPYEREFNGMQKFEPLSRGNEGFVDILQIGRNNEAGYFYYVMELADPVEPHTKEPSGTLSPAGPGGGGGSERLPTTLNPDTYVPHTLSKALVQRGRLPVTECLELGLTLNLGLAHLHRAGLIHRDIKPSNIIFVGGVPKLADIGLVVEASEARSYVGTEGFIPPEGPTSPQADLFSLGKVLYEASMGKDRKDFPEPFTQIAEMPDSRALLEFNAILLKACAASVAERYASAEQMNADLALLQGGGSVCKQRTLNRRLRFAQRTAAGIMILAVLVGAGWGWQAKQTRVVRDLAVEKSRLAREMGSLARENRERLAQFQVEHAEEQIEYDQLGPALPWLAEALRNVEGNLDRERSHRLRLASILENHPKLSQLFLLETPVNFVKFDHQARRIVTIARDRKVRIIGLDTGSVLLTLLHTNDPTGAEFSSDGQRLVTFRRGPKRESFWIWNAVTGESLTPSPADLGAARIRAVTSDGRRFLAPMDEFTVQLRDVDSLAPISGPMTVGRKIEYTFFKGDDDRVLFRLAGNGFQIWSASSSLPLGPIVRTEVAPSWIVGYGREVEKVLTAQDVNIEGELEVTIWNGATGLPLGGPAKLRGEIRAISKHAGDTRLLAFQSDNGPFIWNTKTGASVVLRRPKLRVNLATFSPDGLLLATCDDDYYVSVWNAMTGELVGSRLRHPNMVDGLVFNPNGRELLTWQGRIVRIWDLSVMPQPRWKLGRGISGAQLSPDGRRLATFGQETRIFDTQTARPLTLPFAPNLGIANGRFSPDGRRVFTVAKAQENIVAEVWDTATGTAASSALRWQGREIHFPKQNGFGEFSPDGRLLVTVSNNVAQVWDANGGQAIGLPLQHSRDIVSVSFSSDGRRVVTGSRDGTARVWNAETGTPLVPPLLHGGLIHFAGFSPNGRWIVTTSVDQTLRLWDANTGETALPPMYQGGRVLGASFAADNRLIAAWGLNSKVSIWNTDNGKLWCQMLEHHSNSDPSVHSRVNQANFSPDGRFIVTACANHTARVWDVATGEPVTIPIKHPGEVLEASFSLDSQQILTVTSGDAARLWTLPGRCDFSSEDLAVLGSLLAGNRLDQQGRAPPLSPEELHRLFSVLRKKYPGLFKNSPEVAANWHGQMADIAERLGQWEIVAWHLEKSDEVRPGSTSTRKRLGEVRGRRNE